MALIASAAAGSPLVALLACGTCLLAFRGGWIAGAAAATASGAWLVGQPAVTHAEAPSVLLARALVLIASLVAADELRTRTVGRSQYRGGGKAHGTLEPSGPRRLSAAARKRRSASVDRSADSQEDIATLRRFLGDVRDALGVESAVLWRASRDGELRMVAMDDDVARDVQHDEVELVRWAAHENLVVSNAVDEPCALVAAPIPGDGRPYGVLSLHATVAAGSSTGAQGDALLREYLRSWVGRYADQLATLVELLEVSRTSRRYARQAEQLTSAATRIQQNTDIDSLGRAVCEAAMKVTGASRAAFTTWTPSQDQTEAQGTVLSASPGHPVKQHFPVSADSLVAMACRTPQRFTFAESSQLGAHVVVYGAHEPFREIGSLGVVPLQRDEGSVGAIVVEGIDAFQITQVEVQTLELLATVAAAALETCQHFAHAREGAVKDALTGLANRRAFDERISEMLSESDRAQQPTALVLVDIDHFKSVNDTHGHLVGDAVLRHVAQTVGRTVRDMDLCARYGGEELALVLPQTALTAAREAAERVRKAVESHPFEMDGLPIDVTVSCGVATYPDGTMTHGQLFEFADRALYSAKCAGRNRVNVHTSKSHVV